MPDATGRTLARTARIVASDAQVSAALAGETVILSMADGHYYGVDGVGSRVWGMIKEARNFGELVDTVVAEFEVDETTATADLSALIADMERRGLVTVDQSPA